MSRPSLRPKAVRLLPAAVFAVYVVYASVADPGGGTTAGAGAAGAVGSAMAATGPLGLVGFDKWLHVSTYATLAFLVAAGLSARTGRALLAAALVAVAFGAGMEVVQYPIPARSADLADALANAVGAALGVGLWLVARRLVPRLRPAGGPDA